MNARNFAAALAGAVLLFGTTARGADVWPSKPVTIVAPFGAGSATDTVSRFYAKFLKEETGATVIVENRPGANAMIGSQFVAKSAPDGYTVLMGSGTGNAANYPLYAGRIGYRPESFDTVAIIFVSPPAIFAAPGIPGDTIQKVIAAAAMKSPKGVSCGSGNSVTLVACEMLKRQTGADIVSVSYKGNGQSLLDLAGGQITLAISDMGAAAPLVAEGRVRPVVVAAQTRLSALPGVPSAKEQGLDMDFLSWNGLFVPAGTPEPVIQKLNAAARRMLASPEWEKLRISSSGIEVSGDLAESRKFVASEIAKWKGYASETNVKVE